MRWQKEPPVSVLGTGGFALMATVLHLQLLGRRSARSIRARSCSVVGSV